MFVDEYVVTTICICTPSWLQVVLTQRFLRSALNVKVMGTQTSVGWRRSNCEFELVLFCLDICCWSLCVLLLLLLLQLLGWRVWKGRHNCLMTTHVTSFDSIRTELIFSTGTKCERIVFLLVAPMDIRGHERKRKREEQDNKKEGRKKDKQDKERRER